jgi:hypothetical protein
MPRELLVDTENLGYQLSCPGAHAHARANGGSPTPPAHSQRCLHLCSPTLSHASLPFRKVCFVAHSDPSKDEVGEEPCCCRCAWRRSYSMYSPLALLTPTRQHCWRSSPVWAAVPPPPRASTGPQSHSPMPTLAPSAGRGHLQRGKRLRRGTSPPGARPLGRHPAGHAGY